MFHFRISFVIARMQCCYFEIRNRSIINTNIFLKFESSDQPCAVD